MQRVFEIVRRRGAVSRIERHRDTDDDPGQGGVDTGFQNTDPDAYANQHISGSAGYAREVERHEGSHTEGGHGESDAVVKAKAEAALRAGLTAIVCVGETESQRADGDALSICGGQIVASVPTGMTEADLAIGYEPLWAIGSGRVPTSHEIAQMHAHIRKCLVVHLGPHGKNVRILYGGSVNPADAREILALPGVGGALVGGASLKAEDFLGILGSASSISSHRLDVA